MLQINNGQDLIQAKHHELTEKVIGTFYDVYNELGFGFLESVYREAMRMALVQSGLRVDTEVPINVCFRGMVVGVFRADLVVNDVVLPELKTCEALCRQHVSQTLNYLRATQIEVALLMNFGSEPKFKRVLMDNSNKRSVLSAPLRVKSSTGECI